MSVHDETPAETIRRAPVAIVCGGDLRSGRRDECLDPLHDYPLPNGYGDAHDAAQRRLRKGWTSHRCPRCGLYGWRPGQPTGDACDQRVPASTADLARTYLGETP